MPRVNSDFLDWLNKSSGQMQLNIDHERRIRHLERDAKIQSFILVGIAIALIVIALH